MKKVISILVIAVMLMAGLFVLTGCGNNETTTGGSSSSGTEQKGTVKTNWKNAEVKEYDLEDFAELTNNVPEPETPYTINVISTASGLSISFESESDADKYLQLVKENGFTLKSEIYGMPTYENNTHEIQFSGVDIIIDVK